MPSEPNRSAVATVSYLARVVDAPHRYEWISDSLKEALGYDPRETGAADWWLERVHPHDQQVLQSSLARLADRGQITCHYRVREQAGGYVWIQDQMNLLPRDGQVVGTWTRTSDLKGLEDELEITRQRYLAMVNTVDGVVWEANPENFNFTFASEHAQRLLGYTLEEWYRPGFWHEHVHPDDREEMLAICRSCTLAGQPHHLEYRFFANDGRLVWLHDMVSVICRNGSPQVLRGVMRDVTGRKHAEAERTELLRREQRARAEAEAANTRKDQFLAVLSHELRTPLTPVLARLSLLKREAGLSPRVQSALDMIRPNVELEARIIDDLLDLTKIVQGTLQLGRARVDAHAAIRDALAIYQTDVESRELLMTVDLAALRHDVLADATRLEQVFWNLISNAVKYTPKGGAISIRTRNESGSGFRVPGSNAGSSRNPEPGTRSPTLIVEITDTGIGIEPEVMHRLFNAFEQGEQTLSRRYGGLGLGLSISKTIVDLHGGTLTGSSQGKDKGATFTVQLPALEPAGEARAAPPTAVAPPKLALRILLVEDNEDTQRVLARFLKLAGHQVRTASSVHGALDVAAANDFDLLLCDIGLPDGTGWDLMQTLHARSPIRGVALTGFASSEDAQKSKEAGFAEHLSKPIIPEKLEAIIQQVAS